LCFLQEWGFFRAVQLQTRANNYAATSLLLLAVALSCHSERSEESLILFALFVLAFCSLLPHFATSVCFTNVASGERIYLRDFGRFTGAGSTWSPRNKMNTAAPHAHDF
jgi:hypothetical protein